MLRGEIYSLIEKHKACLWGLEKVSSAVGIFDFIRILKHPKGLEFIMENDFLPFYILDKYRNELEKENIFFDGVHTLVNPRSILILGGKVNIEVNNYEVASIYAKNGVLKLTAIDNSFVTIENKSCQVIIDVLDNAKVREFKK